jgi:predicted outer membrane repeat protein
MKSIYFTCLRIIVLIALLIGLGWTPKPVQAGTITFNIPSPPPTDANDIIPGDKQCVDTNGKCSLRAALQEVNANSTSSDVFIINLSSGSHQLSISPNLNIDRSVTINNNTGVLAMIRGISKTGTININNNVAGSIVVMNNVTISDFDTAITHKQGRFQCNNCTIQYNKRGIQVGGGIATLSSTSVTENEGSHCVGARIIGGTLNTFGTGFSLNKFTSNVSTDAGGAVCNLGGILNLSDSSGIAFNEGKTNEIKKDGAGIFHNSPFETTISNNSSVYNNIGGNGGGIYIGNGYVYLQNTSRIYSNSASQNGGGIYVESNGRLIINREAEIFKNLASVNGGGIYTKTDTQIDGAIISENEALLGGGIYHDDILLSIKNSVIKGNIAKSPTSGGGGGLYVNSNYDLHITNTTFSGNTSYVHGAGIYFNKGFSKLSNITITKNICDLLIDSTDAFGGGIYIGGSSQVYIKNSILAENIDLSGTNRAHDVIGTIRSEGYNLIGECNGSYCTVAGNTIGNLVGTPATPINPQLDVLTIQNSPYFTYFHPIKSVSPAINAGDPLGCKDGSGTILTTDQLGQTRIQMGRCDMGAVESAFTNSNPVAKLVFLPLLTK